MSSSANSVAVTSGSTTAGINGVLLPGGVISGTVTAAVGGATLQGVCVSVSQNGGSATGTAVTAANGTYTINDLPTGSYTVEFSVPGCGNSTNLADQWYSAKSTVTSATPVGVTAGSTASGVNAQMQPGATLSGTVTAASGGADLSGICVLATISGGPTPALTSTASNGTYSIGGLAAGTYTVEFTPGCGNSGSYADQWYNGASSQGSATSVVVGTGANVTAINAAMQLTGSISGTVTASGGGGLASACVTATENGGAGFGSTFTFTGGAYTITGLAPGTYTVDFQYCGSSGAYAEQWYNNQSSSATANPVTVTANSTIPNINAAMVAISPPGAPTIGTATAGNASATVTWTAPSSTGGSPITGYTVTAADSTNAARGGQLCGWTTGTLTCTVTGLTNGDSYTFTVTATNAAGTGPPSAASNSIKPLGVPGAPTGVTASAGNANAVVTWTAPSSNGGSAITGYTVTALDSTNSTRGGQTCAWTTGPLTCTVTGLTNGDSYTFSVTAKNANGNGPPSTASNAVTIGAVPEQPTGVSATAGNANAVVTWTAPASNGGSTITAYTVTALDSTNSTRGGETCGWTTGPLTCTVTGLTNGDSYTFEAAATNAIGMGLESTASNAVTPATAPSAPTIGTATGGNASATVTWSAPSSSGGATITNYTVKAADSTTPANGGETCSWTTGTLTCTVTGLNNGDSYTFTVTATNAAGTGPPSAASNAVTPMTVPGAPTIGTATAGNATATVTWTAPTSNGGSPITGYTVTAADSTTSANGGETCNWTSGPLTCTVTGLTDGDTYTFKVTAKNSLGAGPASAASNSVTPTASVPGAPSIGTATGSNASAIVSWSAPASNGGSVITHYTVTGADSTNSARGGETCTWTTGPLSCTVTGLTNGDSYTFTVTATNAVGTGPASSPSNAVIPMTLPGAPTIGTATGSNASATVTWSAPASNGGSTITSYTVTAADSTTPGNGGETCTWTTGPLTCTIAGLTNGDSYTFTVTATNAVGTGPASVTSNSVTPATVPGAPTIGTATGSNATATVTWSAPGSSGGSTITHYTVSASDATNSARGGETCTWTTGPLSCTVTALTNGDSYSFTATATNAIGTGSASAPSNSVTPATVPGAPTIGTATSSNASATVTWSAPGSKRRLDDHPLHGHRRRFDDSCQRWRDLHVDDRAAQLHGHRPDQRRLLHLHGDGDQCGRHRPRLGSLQPGHPRHGSRRPHHRHRHRLERQCHRHVERPGLQRRLRDHPLHGHRRRLDHSCQRRRDLHLDDRAAQLHDHRPDQR